MESAGFRHWVKLDDLGHLLDQSAEEISAFCSRENISPRSQGRGAQPELSVFDAQARHIVEGAGYVFPRPAKTIACLMCKGGVGKTTTAYFLGLRLASFGARVLFVDADPQGNLTSALGPEKYGFYTGEQSAVLLDVVSGQCPAKDAVLPLTEAVHLIPSTALNSLLDRKLLELGPESVHHFHNALEPLRARYDYIIIDCAPSLNLLNASVVRSSNLVLLPVQLDEFSRNGLLLTLNEILDLQKRFGFKTEPKILLNRFNPVEKLSFLYLGHLVETCRPMMMQSAIRQSSEIKLSLILKQDLFRKKKSRAKEDFDALAREVMRLGVEATRPHVEH